MTTTFTSGPWKLSNGGETASAPAALAIHVETADTAIPDHALTYFEYTVSGAAIQTALTVGFGLFNVNHSNINIHDPGARISNATFLGFSYNLTTTNSGYVVGDPQGNFDYAKTHPGAVAAPNQWPNGSVIGVLVNRIQNVATFTLNGKTIGSFDISGLAGKTIYPFVSGWDKAGPVVTINGGSDGFKEGLPVGYTALDGVTTSASTPRTISPPTMVHPTADKITVAEPKHVSLGQVVLSGIESDPSQNVFIDWHTFGTPAISDSDWVQASVNHTTGAFAATVTVDHARIASTVFAHGSDDAVQAQWSQVPK